MRRNIAIPGERPLTLQEILMREPLPLSEIQDAIVHFLKGREDAVLFGAQAVNVYTKEARISEDVDILSTDAEALAAELQADLAGRFRIAIRVPSVADGKGRRLYQVRKSANRHLADVRQMETLPESERVGDVLVLAPAELIASKVTSYHARKGQPKSWTDRRDLAALLLRFPKLKRATGAVRDRLVNAGAAGDLLATWEAIAAEEIVQEKDEGY